MVHFRIKASLVACWFSSWINNAECSNITPIIKWGMCVYCYCYWKKSYEWCMINYLSILLHHLYDIYDISSNYLIKSLKWQLCRPFFIIYLVKWSNKQPSVSIELNGWLEWPIGLGFLTYFISCKIIKWPNLVMVCKIRFWIVLVSLIGFLTIEMRELGHIFDRPSGRNGYKPIWAPWTWH